MTGWKDIIPERFEKEIVLHAMRIICANIQDAPLILGIDGPPGEWINKRGGFAAGCVEGL